MYPPNNSEAYAINYIDFDPIITAFEVFSKAVVEFFDIIMELSRRGLIGLSQELPFIIFTNKNLNTVRHLKKTSDLLRSYKRISAIGFVIGIFILFFSIPAGILVSAGCAVILATTLGGFGELSK